MIDTKHLYFHVLEDSPCECCGSDISLRWYSAKPTDRWSYSNYHSFTVSLSILNYSALFQLKWNHVEVK